MDYPNDDDGRLDRAFVSGGEGALEALRMMAMEESVRHPEKSYTWLEIAELVDSIRPKIQAAVTLGRTFEALGMTPQQVMDHLGITPDQIHEMHMSARHGRDGIVHGPDEECPYA